jgi:predicted carbohydrate-binding protein with CBM5 and CBM33 domain
MCKKLSHQIPFVLVLAALLLSLDITTGTAQAGGLVAYWPFDTDFSNAEGTAEFDGIPTGSAEISAEDIKVGAGALKIADDTLTANHVVAMGDFVGPGPVVRTVVGWYKYADIDGDGSDARNFVWETQPDWSLSFAIRDGADGKYSQWYNQTETQGSLHGEGPVVDDGLWHHAAVVWNSQLGHVKYYHDGQLLETVNVSTANNPVLDQAGFNIGTHRAADGGRNWDGYIDEIAIFSVELSESQVLGLYEQSATINPLNVLQEIPGIEEEIPQTEEEIPEIEELVAYWPFDTDFSNVEGTADFDGIPTGSAEISAEDVKVGAGALKIADDTLSANHVVAMGDFVGPAPVVRTVVGWYKYADINGDGSDARNFIWETQPNWSLSFAIRDGADGKYSQWYNQTETQGSLHGEGPVVDDGLWHHAAVIWNSELGHIKYYHDGQLFEIVDVNTANNPLLNQVGFNIGTHRAADGGRNWDGYIDEIAIFSIELSEDQILGLYERSETINPLNVLQEIPVVKELVAYWPFDTDFANAEGTPEFDGIPTGTAEISAEDLKVGAGALKIADDTLTANHVVAMGDFVGPAPVVRTVVGWYKYADINGDGSDARNFVWETQPNWSLSFGIRDGADGRYSQWYNQTQTEGSLHGEGPVVDDGLWHHAAVVWNSELGHVKYYHDGQLLEIVDVNTANNPLLDQVGFNIGTHRAADGGRNWDGYIDEIAIFGVELSERQVLGLYEQSETINPLNVLEEIPEAEEDPGKATLPVPEDGALVNTSWIILEWQPGLFAVSHNVFVGVDFDQVSKATLDDVDIFVGNTLDSFFAVGIGSAIPDGLVPGTTYYWRVDEINEADPLSPWKGDVWSFTVQ